MSTLFQGVSFWVKKVMVMLWSFWEKSFSRNSGFFFWLSLSFKCVFWSLNQVTVQLGRIFFILFVKSSLRFYFLFLKTRWTKESGALTRKSKTMVEFNAKLFRLFFSYSLVQVYLFFVHENLLQVLLLRLGSNYIVHSFLCTVCVWVSVATILRF